MGHLLLQPHEVLDSNHAVELQCAFSVMLLGNVFFIKYE